MNRQERYGLLALLAVFLVFAAVYNAVSLPFEAPDEIGHFYYVVYLLQKGQLPVVPASDHAPNYEHEGVQPPLYYASAALFVRALSWPLGLDLKDAGAPLVANPHSNCGRPAAPDNVAALAHDPHQEQFPYQGRVRVLHVIRLWSSLLAALTLAGVFAVARLIFPDLPVTSWLAAGLTAFTPEFLFTAGAASNDTMVTAITTWGVYLAVRTFNNGLRWQFSLSLGVLSGLAAMSKFSGSLLAPLSLLVILLTLLRPFESLRSTYRLALRRWPQAIGHGALVLAPFTAIAAWWFWRNWSLYGDLTGTTPLLAALPLRTEMSVWILARETVGLFQSWWGVLGCTMPPSGFYIFYLALTLLGLVGLVVNYRYLRQKWLPVSVLLAWFALMFVAYARWNWIIHAPKGRLLYPTMASAMCLLGLGWATWAARQRWVAPTLLALLAVMAGAIPLSVMAPPVAPPPVYDTTANIANIHPQHPLDARFGADIALLGYDLKASLETGKDISLTLYWQALAPISTNYFLAIQLVSLVTGDTAMRLNYNSWPGHGNYPTSAWRPGELIVDKYHINLPPGDWPTQGWDLFINLYDEDARLPVYLDGNFAENQLMLTRLRAPGNSAACPEKGQLAAPARFGAGITLTHAWIAPEQDQVMLCWKAGPSAPLAHDYTVFVHLYDAAGQLISTGDGQPMQGAFPTSLWQPGDTILDIHYLATPLQDGPARQRIAVGLYNLLDGSRLPAYIGQEPVPDAAVIVWPTSP